MPDQQELTEQQFGLAYWYVTHKLLLKRIVIGVLIALDAALLGYGIFGLLSHYVLDAQKQRQIEEELVRAGLNPAVHQALVPKPLGISPTQVFAGKNGFDLVTSIRNSNPLIAARFSYRFVAEGFASEPKAGFILPGDDKLIVSLGVTSPRRPANAQLELLDVTWQRINRHQIPDYSTFALDRLAFRITDIKYDPAVALNNTTVGKTSFTVTNATGFGYHDVRFLIVLYRGASPAAVNTLTIENILPGQVRQGEVTWFDPLPAVSKVTVIPEVNIMDDSVYLRP